MIPDKVKIGGSTFDVVLCDSPSDIYRDCDGLISHESLQIRIAKDLAEGAAERILCHEIVHGILAHCNIKMDDEEDFVNRLANALYQVLKDNKLQF